MFKWVYSTSYSIGFTLYSLPVTQEISLLHIKLIFEPIWLKLTKIDCFNIFANPYTEAAKQLSASVCYHLQSMLNGLLENLVVQKCVCSSENWKKRWSRYGIKTRIIKSVIDFVPQLSSTAKSLKILEDSSSYPQSSRIFKIPTFPDSIFKS